MCFEKQWIVVWIIRLNVIGGLFGVFWYRRTRNYIKIIKASPLFQKGKRADQTSKVSIQMHLSQVPTLIYCIPIKIQIYCVSIEWIINFQPAKHNPKWPRVHQSKHWGILWTPISQIKNHGNLLHLGFPFPSYLIIWKLFRKQFLRIIFLIFSRIKV